MAVDEKTAPDLDGQHSDSTQYSRIDNPINLDDIGLTLSETDSDIHHFKKTDGSRKIHLLYHIIIRVEK